MPQTFEQAEAGYRNLQQVPQIEARIEAHVGAECIAAVEYNAAWSQFCADIAGIQSDLAFIPGYDKEGILAVLGDMRAPDQRAVAEYAEAHAPQGDE